MRKHRFLFRFTALMLLLACLSAPALAAAADPVAPCASYYLTSYNAYVCPMGNGALQLWFRVVGTDYMDELGTLRISLYESTDNVNFSRVKTFLHEDYDTMLSYNDDFHASYVSYQGIAGRYYKFYICIWGGKDGQGDTRYFWTSAKLAT